MTSVLSDVGPGRGPYRRLWGARFGFGDDPDQFVGGVQYDFGEVAKRVHIVPNAEIGLGGDHRVLSGAAIAHYRFEPVKKFRFHAGGGHGDVSDFAIQVDAVGGALNLNVHFHSRHSPPKRWRGRCSRPSNPPRFADAWLVLDLAGIVRIGCSARSTSYPISAPLRTTRFACRRRRARVKYLDFRGHPIAVSVRSWTIGFPVRRRPAGLSAMSRPGTAAGGLRCTITDSPLSR